MGVRWDDGNVLCLLSPPYALAWGGFHFRLPVKKKKKKKKLLCVKEQASGCD